MRDQINAAMKDAIKARDQALQDRQNEVERVKALEEQYRETMAGATAEDSRCSTISTHCSSGMKRVVSNTVSPSMPYSKVPRSLARTLSAMAAMPGMSPSRRW